jgi:IS30 family transposase
MRRVLTVSDRAEIATGLKAGWGLRKIARHIGRDVSVVSREVRRNSTKTKGYRVMSAEVSARRRRARPQARKVAADPVLEARVLHDLKWSMTPRQIAGRLSLEAQDPKVEPVNGSPDAGGRTVSHEAIYQYIYATPRKTLAVHGVMLRSKRTSRKPVQPGRVPRKAPIVGMRSISERPAEAEDRRVPGHWEGDLVIGKNGASAVATLVERSSRLLVLVGLPMGKNADGLSESLIATADLIPAMMRKTLTWDQGSEMARHAATTLATGIQVYFADAHSPWQRGSNENTNGLLREYFPKGTQITHHQPYLDAVAYEMNNRPRAVLGFYTPNEVFQKLLTVASTT